jgi:hypothetical protein
LARAIAGAEADADRFAQACRIAAAQIDLKHAQAVRLAACPDQTAPTSEAIARYETLYRYERRARARRTRAFLEFIGRGRAQSVAEDGRDRHAERRSWQNKPTAQNWPNKPSRAPAHVPAKGIPSRRQEHAPLIAKGLADPLRAGDRGCGKMDLNDREFGLAIDSDVIVSAPYCVPVRTQITTPS